MRCNRNKLASMLGRDVKTIDRMVAKGMPYRTRPGQERGKGWVFDSVEVIQWLAGKSLDDQLGNAKTRLTVAKAGLKEIEYLEKLGILHDVDEDIIPFEEVLSITMSRLRDLPGRVGTLIAGETDLAKVQSILEREILDAFKTADRFLDTMRQREIDGSSLPLPHGTPKRRASPRHISQS